MGTGAGVRVLATVALAGVLLLGTAGSGVAAPPRDGEPADIRVVEVVGEASVLQGDVAAARDQALTDARNRAVESAAGVFLEAESVHVRELLLTSTVRLRARGAILSEEVLEEGVSGDGMYRVRLRATVSGDRLADDLVALAEEKTVAVAASLAGPDGLATSREARARIAGGLRDAGFERVVEAERTPPTGSRAARWLGILAGADVVVSVRGRVSSPGELPGGLWTARATGRLVVFRVRAGEVLVAAGLDDARGVGATAEAARQRAAEALAQQVVERVADRLLPARARVVRVQVRNLPDFHAFQRTRNLLAALRWVEEVATDPVGFHRRRTVFLVRTRLDPLSLAAALERTGWFTVARAGREEVVTTWNGD